MSNNKLLVGWPVESRCTKCRRITNHIIVAMEDEMPAKVQCNTCSGQHKYRPPATTKMAAEKMTPPPKETRQKDWQEMKSKIEGAKATDYSMDSSFKINTVMKHPVFGLGLVEKIIGHRKIEVLFEGGRKKLRCL